MRRFFAPEVIQTSALDCGPAALKCLLEGFGINVSYGRLREACQTSVDGTSIDTLETVANQLGLAAEQILIPADQLFLPQAKALPCLLVVTLPNGLTHFVVVWRKCGNKLQVMDPAVGRRWISIKQVLSDTYVHRMPAAATEWREFAAGEDSQAVYSARLRRLGVGERQGAILLARTLGTNDWRPLAALDAAVRLAQKLKDAGAVRSSRVAARLLDRCLSNPSHIPASCWSVQSASFDSDGHEQVLMRGAVLIRVSGAKPPAREQNLGPELLAAISQPPMRPGRALLRIVWQSGPLALSFAILGLVFASGATLIEALLFRGLFDVSTELGLAGQRFGAIAAIGIFCFALLMLELPVFAYAVRIGRHMENRLRTAFLEKIPKLGDRYFQSRLISDMTERSHVVQRLRDLAGHVHQLLRAILEFCFTALGIIWLEPANFPEVAAIVAIAIVPAFAVQALLSERDLRVRTHAAGLTRFYLDAMLGLIAVRTHGAENAVRREHERFLGEWTHASVKLQQTATVLEALQLTAIYGLIAALFLSHPFHGADIGRVLLIAYWVLNLPALGQEIGTLLRQYPAYRNLTLRLIEPLGAPEEPFGAASCDMPAVALAPSLAFRDVSVEVSGHRILENVSFDVAPGSHVAIVGPSGAGKSSLLGVILGWLKPACGEVLVDDTTLNAEQLRSSIAWVDPAVQLWNRSLFANLSYGSSIDAARIAQAVDDAMLRTVLETLPSGLQTELGESGALLSGGEGQRVRLARAFLRENVRLVLLDEPFRGLDREKRSGLLSRARKLWPGCTLLCITHDLAETLHFDRVLVVESGRVIEHGCPRELAANIESRYSQLLSAEQENRTSLWAADLWRHVRLHAGRIVEDTPARRHSSAIARPESEVA